MDTGLVIMAVAFCLGVPLVTAGVALFSEKYQPALKPLRVKEDSPARAALITFAVWAPLTAILLYAVLTVDFYPTVASDKGEEIAHAFRVLTALAVPVFTMVVSVVLYSVLRRGTSASPDQDGPPILGQGLFPNVWLGVTAGLTLLIIIYPGLTSLSKVMKTEENPDLVIQVEGVQWTWLIGYPDYGISNQRDLVIPVDRTVNFLITSRDVLHSFWIPSMLMKTDAVPGRTTTISLRATKTGDFQSDPQVRLQCTELCGLGHSSMSIPVSVVSQREFDAWVQQKKASVRP